MRFRKTVALGGIVVVVAGLILASTALAQTPTPTPNKASGSYANTFMDRLAGALGVSRQKLDEGLTQARNDTLDQAVKDGKLTREQADKIKARQPQGSAPGMRGIPFGPKGGDRKGVVVLFGSSMHEVIAKALGMTSDELTNQLRSGKTLKELAEGKEQAVKDAILKAQKERLDQAVKNGRLTQAQADSAYERLQKADPLSMMGSGPYGTGHGPGMGPMAPGKGPMWKSAPRKTAAS